MNWRMHQEGGFTNMGETVQYTCLKCGETYTIRTGDGFMWHDYSIDMFYPKSKSKDRYSFNIYDELNPRIKKEVHKFLEDANNDVIITDVYWQPYICEKCGKVTSKITFTLTNENDEIYKPTYKCHCRGLYTEIPEDMKVFTCHKCHNIMAETCQAMWD